MKFGEVFAKFREVSMNIWMFCDVVESIRTRSDAFGRVEMQWDAFRTRFVWRRAVAAESRGGSGGCGSATAAVAAVATVAAVAAT